MQRLFDLQNDVNRNTAGSRKPRHRHSGKRPQYFFDFTSEKGFLRRVSGGWPIPSFENQLMVWDAAFFAGLAQRALRCVEIDWLVFAQAIYSADRFAARRPAGPNGPTFWRRRIEIIVPVESPAHWDAVINPLTAALEFLTEDDWILHFVKRTSVYAEEYQQQFRPIKTPGFNRVALFSGGLDSVAGVLRLMAGCEEPTLLVSGNTNTRLREAQEQLVGLFQSRFHSHIAWLPVHYGFDYIIEQHGMESSQRSRGWMHVGIGLLAAFLTAVDHVSIFENGTGAFNLSCETSQFGSQNSRAIHPVFLQRIAAAASDLLGRKLCVSNPFVFDTKGATLLHPAVAANPDIIAESFSCEFFPNYNSRQRQCGVCPSCLIRRAALFIAGLPDNGDTYSWDILQRGLPSSANRRLGAMKLERFTARMQRILWKHDPWDAFVIDYPKYGVSHVECANSLGMGTQDFCTRLLNLQRNFMPEWQMFAERISGLRHSAHSLSA